MWKPSVGIATLLTLLFLPLGAAGLTLDFDSLSHGDILLPAILPPGLVSVTAKKVSGGAFVDAPAIVFDTTLEGTEDPDLEDPWAMGNIPNDTILGRVVIVQGDESICSATSCVAPDGVSGPNDPSTGGLIRFEFSQSIDSFGFVLLDIDGAAEVSGGVGGTSRVRFFQGDTPIVSLSFADIVAGQPDIELGNNSANRIDPLSVGQSFDAVEIQIMGSFAVDSVMAPLDLVVVPEPHTSCLIAFGLAGLATLRRRVR